MTINIDKEVDLCFDVDYLDIINKTVLSAIKCEGFMYDVQVNVILTDNKEVHILNKEYRNVDRPTDVLSFPQIEYDAAGDFSIIEENIQYYCDKSTNEVVLGDIVISIEKVIEQANEYGHSIERELGFLVAHSMLHLFGYDHMEPEEDAIMQQKQELILMNA